MNTLPVRIATLSPQPGDTLVITTPWPMSREQIDQMRAEVKAELAPGIGVIVLCAGSSLMHVTAPTAASE